mgnify:CR=1 FL=1
MMIWALIGGVVIGVAISLLTGWIWTLQLTIRKILQQIESNTNRIQDLEQLRKMNSGYSVQAELQEGVRQLPRLLQAEEE